MTAIFRSTSFSFETGEEVEHIEEWPSLYAMEPAKWHVMGHDTFDGEDYPLALNIDDLPTATMLAIANQRYLEIVQPSATSGGQEGIQDRVFVVHPVPS